MSRVCEICEKSYVKGNKVQRGIGKRVTNRSIKKQKPNLRTKRIKTPSGNKVTIKLCASCLKRMKFNARKAEEAKTE